MEEMSTQDPIFLTSLIFSDTLLKIPTEAVALSESGLIRSEKPTCTYTHIQMLIHTHKQINVCARTDRVHMVCVFALRGVRIRE